MPILSVTRGPDLPAQVPSYRRHKPTGQAVVTLNGHDVYLGKWNTKASRVECDRLIGEWLAAGRCLPGSNADLTVAELALRYWRFAQSYYVIDHRPTASLPVIRVALRHLRDCYGHTPVADFGPLALEALQLKMVGDDLSRSTVNEQIACIRRAFRWGVAKQLVPGAVLQALQALPGLRKGRSPAREPEPVRPVADEVVDATLPHLPEVVADMVRFQRLTGCRPAEVCILRPCDVDTAGDVWSYRPESHKTEHRGRQRMIFIGPKRRTCCARSCCGRRHRTALCRRSRRRSGWLRFIYGAGHRFATGTGLGPTDGAALSGSQATTTPRRATAGRSTARWDWPIGRPRKRPGPGVRSRRPRSRRGRRANCGTVPLRRIRRRFGLEWPIATPRPSEWRNLGGGYVRTFSKG